MGTINRDYEEKILNPKSGGLMLFIIITVTLLLTAACIFGGVLIENGNETLGAIMLIAGVLLITFVCVLYGGFKILDPNEARVFVLFGKYYGTLAKEGFYWVNPFCVSVNPATKPSTLTGAISINFGARKISLKAMTLVNDKQKVNDLEGNPVEIGVVVIWRIINTSKAVFNVDNYVSFVSTQADSAIRHVARLYPYDISNDGDEKSLRGSSQEIAETLKNELQERVKIAGIEIMEARISHLAYAPEIAAAMLQRQQASAIIAARQKIVEGAVGMVEMALSKLSENNIVTLDDERKAAMVSNLLVVLCGNRDAQPIVNSGSIY